MASAKSILNGLRSEARRNLYSDETYA